MKKKIWNVMFYAFSALTLVVLLGGIIAAVITKNQTIRGLIMPLTLGGMVMMMYSFWRGLRLDLEQCMADDERTGSSDE